MRKAILLGFLLVVVAGITLALPPQAKADERGPLEKVTLIHYKKGSAKPPWAGGGSGGDKGSCYKFLAKGAKWKQTEPYLINPTNSQGLSDELVVGSAISADNEWDNRVAFNVFGQAFVD